MQYSFSFCYLGAAEQTVKTHLNVIITCWERKKLKDAKMFQLFFTVCGFASKN